MQNEEDRVYVTTDNVVECLLLTRYGCTIKTTNAIGSALLWSMEKDKRDSWEIAKKKAGSRPTKKNFWVTS